VKSPSDIPGGWTPVQKFAPSQRAPTQVQIVNSTQELFDEYEKALKWAKASAIKAEQKNTVYDSVKQYALAGGLLFLMIVAPYLYLYTDILKWRVSEWEVIVAPFGFIALYWLGEAVQGTFWPKKGIADEADYNRWIDDLVIQRLMDFARPGSLSGGGRGLKEVMERRDRNAEVLNAALTVTTTVAALGFLLPSVKEPAPWTYFAAALSVFLAGVTLRAKRTRQQCAHFLYCLEEGARRSEPKSAAET
jgi:hypothetical protein